MIKVLQIVNALDGGGIENMILNYYMEFDRTEYQFDFITHSDNGNLEKVFLELGSNIYRVPPFSSNKSKNLILTKKIIDTGNYDIIHSHMGIASIFSMFFAYKKNIKGRITHSHLAYRKESNFRRIIKYFVMKLLYKYSTEFFACSKDAAKFMLGDYGSINDVKIINNAINPEKFLFNYEIREKVRRDLDVSDNFVVGNVARFDYQKNHEFLIDIFYEIHKRDNNARLLLIGNGMLENEIRSKVTNLKLNNVVKFLGVRNDVNNLMQAMDVFLLPSRFEGLGMVFVEAQANGLKCFGSDTVVPEDAKITELMNFVSLDQSPKYWADRVLSVRNHQRIATKDEVKKAGYDIKEESSKLVRIYDKYK